MEYVRAKSEGRGVVRGVHDLNCSAENTLRATVNAPEFKDARHGNLFGE